VALAFDDAGIGEVSDVVVGVLAFRMGGIEAFDGGLGQAYDACCPLGEGLVRV